MCKRLYRIFTTLPLICAAALTIQSCSCNNGRSACHDYDMLANDMVIVETDSGSDEAYQDEIGAYSAFAEHFSDTTYFALADVSGHQVLLVSHEVFGNNVNSDKEAIAASIFAHDDKGKIVSLGSIRSQGTLYPVSILDGKIMVAGHQFVRIYSIRDEGVPELVLDSYAEGDGPELDDWFRTFEKGTAVKFRNK